MTREDDRDDHLIDGEAVTAEEREQARRMAGLVDDLVERRPAFVRTKDERSLVDAAAILRTAARRELLVAEVLAQGARKQTRWRRRAPWLGAAVLVAAAAIIMVLLRPPSAIDGGTVAANTQVTPERLRSRPADALIGQIKEGEEAAARARMDRIVADRMAGYRQLMLGRGGAR